MMELTEIAFPRLTGIQRDDSGRLLLQVSDAVRNHLGTIHAGAQFTLAETASADHLQRLFPDLRESVVPVLRASQVKYRQPADTTVHATASTSEDARQTLRTRLDKKGWGSISVEVELRDANDKITCQGAYEWYVQKLPSAET